MLRRSCRNVAAACYAAANRRRAWVGLRAGTPAKARDCSDNKPVRRRRSAGRLLQTRNDSVHPTTDSPIPGTPFEHFIKKAGFVASQSGGRFPWLLPRGRAYYPRSKSMNARDRLKRADGRQPSRYPGRTSVPSQLDARPRRVRPCRSWAKHPAGSRPLDDSLWSRMPARR